MSFPTKHSSTATLAIEEKCTVGLLNDRQITLLNKLLLEKSYRLNSKTEGIETIGITVNEIAISIISAYACCYEAFQYDSSKKTYKEIFTERDLACGFKIKGSTVAKILQEIDLKEESDLDLSLEFNKIPLPISCKDKPPEEILGFLKSNDSRSYLYHFYKQVAFEATKRILLIERQKIIYQNLYRHLEGLAPLPIKSDSFIEFLKDKFFNNLILFSDHSRFLITFSTIDIAIKVPFLNLASSFTHMADSLSLEVPFNLPYDSLAPKKSFLSSPFSIAEALKCLQLKKIAIPDASAVLYNGFERIMYSLTQGWTVTGEESLLYLLKDLSIRSAPELQITAIPLERLYQLLMKKKEQGAGSFFLLRVLLNAYLTADHFAKKGDVQASLVCDWLCSAFARSEYQAFFPKILKDHLACISNLKQFIELEQLHVQLQFSYSNPTDHLGVLCGIFGPGDKSEGSLLTPYLGLKPFKEQLELAIKNLGEAFVLTYLDPSIDAYKKYPLAFKQKTLFKHFSHLCSLQELPKEINQELIHSLDEIMDMIHDYPSLLLINGFYHKIYLFLEKNKEAFLSINPEWAILLTLLPREDNYPVISLLYKTLQNKPVLDLQSILKQAYFRKDIPVIFGQFINFLLNTSSIPKLNVFQLIEQSHIVLDLSISTSLLMHPEMNKLLKDELIIKELDIAFWEKSLLGNITAFLSAFLHPEKLTIFKKNPLLFQRVFKKLPLKEGHLIFLFCLKTAEDDLLLQMLSTGLCVEILLKIQKEESALLKTIAFTRAFGHTDQFVDYIRSFLEPSSLNGLNLINMLIEQEDLTKSFLDHLETLSQLCLELKNGRQFAELLAKLIPKVPKTLPNAIAALQIANCLDLSKKPCIALYKGCFDQFGEILIAIQASSKDSLFIELMKQALIQSNKLMQTGVCFKGRWGVECEALSMSARSLEECLIECIKKPTEALFLSLIKKLNEASSKIEEPLLIKLKDLGSSNSEFTSALLKHILLYQTDEIREKFTKELFSKISEDRLKWEVFNLYIEYSESFKNIITIFSNLKIDLLSVDACISLLSKLFGKANPDIKIAILNKFKDTSRFRFEKIDHFFEFTKAIPPSIKKNSLLDFFIPHFSKLTPLQQQTILKEPLYLYNELKSGDQVLSLTEKAKVCSKALEHLITIINKRSQEGFYLKREEFFEILTPVFEHTYTNYMVLEHTDLIHRFFEKYVQLKKDWENRYSLSLIDRFLTHFEEIPLYDLVQEMLCFDPANIPVSMLLLYLEKRKHMPAFTKIEGDKYIKVFKHLIGKIQTPKLLDFYQIYEKLNCFNDQHKKELLCLIIAKSIEEKHYELWLLIFGTKQKLGFTKDTPPFISISILPSASKASKKLVFDSLLKILQKADSIKSIRDHVLTPLKFVIDAFTEDGFTEVFKEIKSKVFTLLHKEIEKAKTIENLSVNIINPIKLIIPHFDPSKETTDLMLAVLKKCVTKDALIDCLDNPSGFADLLFTIMHLSALRTIESEALIFDVSKEPVLTTILDLLSQKLHKIGPFVDLVNILNQIQDFKSSLKIPFSKVLVVKHQDQIIEYIRKKEPIHIVYLMNLLKEMPRDLYLLIAEALKERRGSISLYILTTQFSIHHSNLSKILIKHLKDSERLHFYESILAFPLDLFINNITTYFDLDSDIEEIIPLLESFRKRRRLNAVSFYSNLKTLSASFYSTIIPKVTQELADVFCAELEIQRAIVNQSILEFTQNLSKDPFIGKAFFNFHSKCSTACLIHELKKTSIENYSKAFLLFQTYWIQENLFCGHYPTILEDFIEKTKSLIIEHHEKGGLTLEKLDILLHLLNVQMLCYPFIKNYKDYPTAERFNPLFLEGLSVMLSPYNITKNTSLQITSIYEILQNLSESQFTDLICLENKEKLMRFFHAILYIHTLDPSDYFKLDELSKETKKEQLEKTQACLKINIYQILKLIQEKALPRLLEKRIDVFLSYFIILLLFNMDGLPIELQKSHYKQVYAISKTYLENFMSTYTPKKEEGEIIPSLLSLFSLDKSKEEREFNAMAKLPTLSKDDADDFIFHSIQILIKKTQTELGIG